MYEIIIYTKQFGSPFINYECYYNVMFVDWVRRIKIVDD